MKEYIEAVRERYLKASRKEKGQILDEVNRVTGYHRKAVIRLLRRSRMGSSRVNGPPRRRRSGRGLCHFYARQEDGYPMGVGHFSESDAG